MQYHLRRYQIVRLFDIANSDQIRKVKASTYQEVYRIIQVNSRGLLPDQSSYLHRYRIQHIKIYASYAVPSHGCGATTEVVLEFHDIAKVVGLHQQNSFSKIINKLNLQKYFCKIEIYKRIFVVQKVLCAHLQKYFCKISIIQKYFCKFSLLIILLTSHCANKIGICCSAVLGIIQNHPQAWAPL